MTDPSFASVYRAAAILAAFSQASASGEEQPRDESRGTPEDRHVSGPFFKEDDRQMGERLLSGMARFRKRVRFAVARIAADPGRRPWQAHGQSIHPAKLQDGLPRPLVLSHFAFCDAPDHGDRALEPSAK